MDQPRLNRAARNALSSNYVMESNTDAFLQGFHIGAAWHESHTWTAASKSLPSHSIENALARIVNMSDKTDASYAVTRYDPSTGFDGIFLPYAVTHWTEISDPDR